MRPTLDSLRRREDHITARVLAAVVVTLVCAALFAWIHAVDNARVLAATPHIPGQPSDGQQVLTHTISAVGQWALFAFAGLAIALRTRRPELIILPGALFVALPSLLTGGVQFQSFADYYGFWGQPSWIAALTDLSLAVVPGLFAALLKPGRAWQIRRHEVLALALIAIVVAGVAVPRSYHDSGTFTLTSSAVIRVVSMLAIGFGLGIQRKTFPWLHILLAALAANAAELLALHFIGPAEWRVPILSNLIGEFWGPAGAILAGSLCAPFAGYLRTRSVARAEQRATV